MCKECNDGEINQITLLERRHLKPTNRFKMKPNNWKQVFFRNLSLVPVANFSIKFRIKKNVGLKWSFRGIKPVPIQTIVMLSEVL